MTSTTTEGRELPLTTAMGAVLHQLMWQNKVSQVAVGKALGKAQTVVGKKLRGEVPITLDELAVFARLVQVDPAELVLRACRDSNPKPSDP